MTGELVVRNKTDELIRIDARSIIPAAIREACPKAEERFAEFFGASIRNVNTRMTYIRAVKKFFAWVDTRKLGLPRSARSTSLRTSSNSRASDRPRP